MCFYYCYSFQFVNRVYKRCDDAKIALPRSGTRHRRPVFFHNPFPQKRVVKKKLKKNSYSLQLCFLVYITSRPQYLTRAACTHVAHNGKAMSIVYDLSTVSRCKIHASNLPELTINVCFGQRYFCVSSSSQCI